MKHQKASLGARVGVALLALFLSLSASGAALAATYALVSGTESLNLRAGASSSSQWLGAYPRGAWVTVTGSQNNFYQVTTADHQTGYMSKNFLKTTDQVASGNVAIVSNQRDTAFLNLRDYPSYSARVIAILYNGVPLTILSEDAGWYRVQMGATVGYVRSEFTTPSYQPLGIAVATIKTPNNTAVNLRTGPSASAAVRKQFAGDRYVSVLYQGNGWWYVCIDRFTGFISSDFLVEGLHAARDNAQQGDTGEGYALVNNPVSSQHLNMRQLPSTAASIVARLANGYRLSVVVQGTEWSQVYADTFATTGYVLTRYLSLHNLPVTPKLTIHHPQGSFVNLRSAATMTADVVARIPDGAQAIVVAPGPDWSKVKYNGLVGYVMNYFTTLATNP